MKLIPESPQSPMVSQLPECQGRPDVCRFLEKEGRPALVAYFRKRAPWSQAEDLAHEAFVKAWTHCADVREPDRARQWLFGIARNQLVDGFRRGQLRSERTLPFLEEALPTADEELSGGSFRAELVHHIRERLDLLPPEQRSVVEALLNGERQTDIARRLGLPLSTVKTQAQRARRRIRDFAEGQCAFHRDAFGRVIGCDPRTASCCA